jgi:hypothetical protein
MKCHFPDNDFIVFGIQRADVAEAVLKNNARIVFGAVSESHFDGLKKQCYPRFQKQCAHCFRGRLRNLWRRPAKTMPPLF